MDPLNTPPEPALPPPPIEEIARETVRDVSQVFHFNPESWWFAVMQKMLMIPATKFASIMRSADLKVGMRSLWEAARDLLPRFSGGCQVRGGEHLPKDGPLLVVSNHPGATDSLAVLAVLERSDVHMVANARPTLEILPNTSEHLVYLNKQVDVRMATLRNLIQLLEKGNTVVLFPRGDMEPEPSLFPGSLESLSKWSESIGVLLSKVPETILQLVLTRDVITREAWEHPITRFGKTLAQKHEISVVLQLIVQSLFNKWKIPIRMTLSDPIAASDLDSALNPRTLNAAVREFVGGEMKKTFEIL